MLHDADFQEVILLGANDEQVTWSLSALGEDRKKGVRRFSILASDQLTDEGLRQVGMLTGLVSLDISLTWEVKDDRILDRVTDEGYRHLSELKDLQSLVARGRTTATTVGLGHIAKLGNLRYLDLGGLPFYPTHDLANAKRIWFDLFDVSSALEMLAEHPKLEHLRLPYRPLGIVEKDLSPDCFPSIRSISLSGPEAGWEKFFNRLPDEVRNAIQFDEDENDGMR